MTINTKDCAGRKTTARFENWNKKDGFYVNPKYPKFRISGKNHSWKVEIKLKEWKPVAFNKDFTKIDPNGVYPRSLTSAIHAIEKAFWKK